MRVKQFLVLPNLPERIRPLHELASNLWYCWHWDVVRLFIRLDADIWEECYQNPVEMLARLPQKKLEEAAEDDAFLANLDKVYQEYQGYLSKKKWWQVKHPEYDDRTIAYFSLEYGLDTGLPVYSGGLGVLSGDTLKTASDLGMPLVAIGLLYRYGYFRQFLSADGWQQERYEENDWYHMPVEMVKDDSGNPLRVGVDLGDMPVQIQVWKVKVGITPLYLLDTNIPENSSKAREITSVLYGGDKDMRIRQEIVLGIGGVRALTALGIKPDIYHSNEGHSWFLALERLHQLMTQEGLSFDEASQYLWSTSVFTTHTPVPAGNERFDPVLVHRYLGQTIRQLGISWNDFLSMGRVRQEDDTEPFNMTVAALKSSAFANGVSRLHGRVSREMWHNIWPNLPREEVPIRSITNGVHPASWISHDMYELYESYLGPRFTESPADTDIWGKVQRIPEMELWRVHNKRRERLVYFARKRLRAQLERRGVSQLEVQRASQVLDPQILTIGFARRFSTYKRGNLLFQDADRLARIVADDSHPVQIIISGKAHPLDTPGKEIIKKIIEHAGEVRFRQRVIFLEDYDINIARYLVQGCDVWLNNPRRPQEASGTSGMKAAFNGALNLSVLDGWWDEGFNDDVGFRIGNGEDFDNIEVQDRMDGESLYNALENEVVPLFYDRDEIDMPQAWLTRMKAAIAMAGTHFSTQRMMKDYSREFYLPAIDAGTRLRDNGYALTRDVTAWMSRVSTSWDKITIRKVDIPDLGPTVHVGQKIPVEMDVFLDGVTPEDVNVEIISGRLNSQEQLLDFAPAQAQLNGSGSERDNGVFHYFCEVTCHESGRFGITARILPRNENLLHTFKPKLISWW